MLTSLGGVGALLNGIIENFGTLLIIIFFADLVYMMSKKHDYDFIKYQRDRISKMLPDLIKAAELKIEDDQEKKSEPYKDDEKIPEWMNLYFKNQYNKDHQHFIEKMKKYFAFCEAEEERNK